MREMLKMVIVMAVLTCVSGGLLAAIRNGTLERIENQQLQFVKGPAIREIMEGASNDPIKDQFKIKDGETERSLFVGKFDGKPKVVALETYGKGYGGDVGLMVGNQHRRRQYSGGVRYDPCRNTGNGSQGQGRS